MLNSKKSREKTIVRILFSRSWNKKTIKSIVNDNCYLKFADYENLKALCVCPFAEDETFYKPDYHEMTFIVPVNWLKEVVSEMFNVVNLDDWLKNAYTTDESELIFERALDERMVVMVDFR